MRNRRFWIPVIVSVPVTIICIVISAVTADFGFKTYVAAMIFFPYMMLSTLWFGEIPPAVAIAGLFQWPLYGIIIGRAWVKNKFIVAVEILLLIHVVAAVAAITFIIYDDRSKPEIVLPGARRASP